MATKKKSAKKQKSLITNKNFLLDILERAIKTFCQVMLSFIGVQGLGFGDINWMQAISISGVSAIASILTSVASYESTGSVSLVKDK